MNNYRDYYNYANNNYNQPNYKNTLNANIYDPYQGFIRGNMFPDLYNTYKLNKPVEIMPKNEQTELLTYIDALCFALIDLNLFLDLNPNDENAIRLYNEYRKEKDMYMRAYQDKFGPISLDSANLDGSTWKWIKSPWPWECEY